MAKKNIQKEITQLILSNDPDIRARAILPTDTEEIIEDKQRKPFKTHESAALTVRFNDDSSLMLFSKEGYTYDGATIPFKIGKGNMKLLIPALFHDIMCENKHLVNYGRNLSSKIFYEGLLLCHINKYIAKVMYFFVDNFQKLIKGWK